MTNTLHLPNIEDFNSKLERKIIFSIVKEDILRMKVTTPFGLLEFFKLQFYLQNVAPSFRRYMQSNLRNLSFVSANIDDILVASINKEEHKIHFDILSNNNINPSKCTYGVSESPFLEYKRRGYYAAIAFTDSSM